MNKITDESLIVKKQKLNKLSIPTIEGFELIDTVDIIYLEAKVNYTNIFLSNKTKIISSKNLGFYELELSDEPFIRIHNSTVINLSKVKSYIRGDDGWVIMLSGETLKVSKSKKDDLFYFFQEKKQNNK